MSNSKLREFIKIVRSAKTNAEEKQLFLKEKGLIRESFLVLILCLIVNRRMRNTTKLGTLLN